MRRLTVAILAVGCLALLVALCRCRRNLVGGDIPFALCASGTYDEEVCRRRQGSVLPLQRRRRRDRKGPLRERIFVCCTRRTRRSGRTQPEGLLYYQCTGRGRLPRWQGS